MRHYSFPPQKIKILLLEGISDAAAEQFSAAGYAVETSAKALDDDELKGCIGGVHVLGIRSKTEVRASALANARNLLAIGCFCIGTNQVDTETSCSLGIPVFNAPFSNTRSVAELVIAEIVMLSRKASWKSQEMHSGKWAKSATGCHEVKGKSIGIVGYGHIGPQVGILAEAFGMRVHFYDIAPKLALGSAVKVGSLKGLLETCDFVTLHVPETPETKGMIGHQELQLMKRGSCLLNLSRGTVVDLAALKDALRTGHLAGAALDVFPQEPHSNSEPFHSELQNCPNVILTPHIGGSTEEAQLKIGLEVSESLLKFIETGSTSTAVNFPTVELPVVSDFHRILNIHRNTPGVLKGINEIISNKNVNIRTQYLATRGDIGYLIIDVEPGLSRAVKEEIDSHSWSIRTRLLF